VGRLQALTRAAALCLAALPLACDKETTPAPGGRSEQVIATGRASAATSSATAPHPSPSAPGRAGKLCDGDGSAGGRSLPKTAASHVEASGAERLEGSLHATPGEWTWINFWAAWCGPCKEEIPRLFGWRERLAKAGTPIHLVFVSLDDDERQLRSFLEAQPVTTLRSTLWLPDGKRRSSWLTSLRMESGPELPEHALADGTGRIRCFIQGAVEDGDYAEIAALVR
jgi:thiol-disulfide isomerase/thioredoxin